MSTVPIHSLSAQKLDKANARSPWRAYLFPCLLLVFSVIFCGWLGFRPEPSKPVVIFFSPFVSSLQALERARGAGALVLRFGAYPNSLIVQSDQPNFFANLRQVGVWFMADAAGMEGCAAEKRIRR